MAELNKTITPVFATKYDTAKPIGLVSEATTPAGLAFRLYVAEADGTQIDFSDTQDYWAEVPAETVDMPEETVYTFLLDCAALYAKVKDGTYLLNARLYYPINDQIVDTVQAGILILQEVLQPGQ